MRVHRGQTKILGVLLYRSPPDSFETVFFFSPDLEPVWWSASPSDLPAYLCPPQCSGYQDVQPHPALSMGAEDLSLYPYAYRADILTFGTLYPNLVLLAYF